MYVRVNGVSMSVSTRPQHDGDRLACSRIETRTSHSQVTSVRARLRVSRLVDIATLDSASSSRPVSSKWRLRTLSNPKQREP